MKADATSTCQECGTSWTVEIERPASATYRSPGCRKTGLTQAAHWAEWGVGPRIRPLHAPGHTPFPPTRWHRMLRSNGLAGRVDGMNRCRTRARGGDVRMPSTTGSATRDRRDELVKPGHDWVAPMSSTKRRLGDAALEIDPIRLYRIEVRIRPGRTICSPSARPSGCSPSMRDLLKRCSAAPGRRLHTDRRRDSRRMSRAPSARFWPVSPMHGRVLSPSDPTPAEVCRGGHATTRSGRWVGRPVLRRSSRRRQRRSTT